MSCGMVEEPHVAVLSDGHHTEFGTLLLQILSLSSLAERPVSGAYLLPARLLAMPSRGPKLITCCIKSCNVRGHLVTWPPSTVQGQWHLGGLLIRLALCAPSLLLSP